MTDTVEIPPLLLPSWSASIHSDWRWARLHDLCTDIVDCPHSTPTYSADGEYFIARTQDFADGVLDLRSAARVDAATFRERTRRALPRFGDLIYSREGAYHGIAAELPRSANVCLGQRTVLIRPDTSKAHFRFLRYWLNSELVRHYVGGHRTGSAAPRINLPTIRGLPVAVPPLHEQAGIARVLGALDDKIQLNRRMNETLEATARALFRSWFIEFDPVHAKAAGRAPTGMGANTAALFPDDFETTELGLTPVGWPVAPLGSMFSWERDTLDPSTQPLVAFEHFSIPAFDAGGVPVVELGAQIKSNKFLVPAESVLVSKLNPAIDRVWLPEPGKRGVPVCSTEFLVAMPRTVPRSCLYAWLREPTVRQKLGGIASGTSNSHQRIRPSDIESIQVVRPPDRLLAALDDIVSPLLGRIACNQRESMTLVALRDLLLPRLISGELRIRNAERDVEKIA